jgi:hypothetical protein
MLEIELAVLLRSVIVAGLAVRSITAEVKAANQSRQQGVPSGPAIFFFHVDTLDVGWPKKFNVWNPTTSVFDVTKTQRRESRWQIGSLAPQTPSTTAMTSADYALAVKSILSDDVAINTFAASGVGIQHTTLARSVWFQDDKNQNEENPSFDVILSHQEVVVSHVSKIDIFNPNVGVA